MSELKQLLKQLIGNPLTAQTIPGTVVEVDKTTNTCTFQPADDSPEMYDVRLTASIDEEENVFVVCPAIGSDVLVTLINGNENVAFVSLVSQVEEISLSIKEGFKYRLNKSEMVFNDGSNGGLTITPKLVEELNKTNALLNSIITVLNGTPILEPGNGAASSLQTALKAAIAGKSVGNYSQIENTKIKH